MLLACPACQTKNRVPDERLTEEPVCGRCGAALMPAEPIALDDRTLPLYLSGTELPVLVDFWAAWCGPCKVMAPQFAAAARQVPRVRFAKVDTDACPVASSKYGIRSIPSLILFRNGQEVGRLAGAVSAAELVRWLGPQAA